MANIEYSGRIEDYIDEPLDMLRDLRDRAGRWVVWTDQLQAARAAAGGPYEIEGWADGLAVQQQQEARELCMYWGWRKNEIRGELGAAALAKLYRSLPESLQRTLYEDVYEFFGSDTFEVQK